MNILFFLTPKKELEYLKDDYTVRQAIERTRSTRYTALPIINHKDGTYVATATEGDFLWYMLDSDIFKIKDLEEEKLLNIVNKERYKPVRIDAEVDDLLKLIMNQNFVPVVDDRGVFMGIITRRRIIDYYYNQNEYLEAYHKDSERISDIN